MPPERITLWLRQRPFLPFRVRMANGIVYDITHPDQAIVMHVSMSVYADSTTRSTDSDLDRDKEVSLAHVVELEPIHRYPSAARPNRS